jgi:hypothetical protein
MGLSNEIDLKGGLSRPLSAQISRLGWCGVFFSERLWLVLRIRVSRLPMRVNTQTGH